MNGFEALGTVVGSICGCIFLMWFHSPENFVKIIEAIFKKK